MFIFKSFRSQRILYLVLKNFKRKPLNNTHIYTYTYQLHFVSIISIKPSKRFWSIINCNSYNHQRHQNILDLTILKVLQFRMHLYYTFCTGNTPSECKLCAVHSLNLVLKRLSFRVHVYLHVAGEYPILTRP